MKLNFKCDAYRQSSHGKSEMCNCDRDGKRTRNNFRLWVKATANLKQTVLPKTEVPKSKNNSVPKLK
jgi:hypothetical protein